MLPPRRDGRTPQVRTAAGESRRVSPLPPSLPESWRNSPALLVILLPPGRWEKGGGDSPSTLPLGLGTRLGLVGPLSGPLMLGSKVSGRTLLLGFLASS